MVIVQTNAIYKCVVHIYGSPMARSQKATTVAVLRGILGTIHGQEKRFAKLVGKSVSWVKKVSAGITPLSEDSARVLESATGVNLNWLLAGDARTPPVGSAGKCYTLADFESHRASLKTGDLKKITVIFPVAYLPTIAAIGSSAGRAGRVSLFSWRLDNFLNECREEFGFDKEAESQTMSECGNILEKIGFYDSCSDPVTKRNTTFNISRTEGPEAVFGTEIKAQIHPPEKRRSKAK
jgi:hypothetical protein